MARRLTAEALAEKIMQVRGGTLSASEAARQLGISRKTYYQWESRGLKALLEALTRRPAGRPPKARDWQRERLQAENQRLNKEVALLQETMRIREMLGRSEKGAEKK